MFGRLGYLCVILSWWWNILTCRAWISILRHWGNFTKKASEAKHWNTFMATERNSVSVSRWTNHLKMNLYFPSYAVFTHLLVMVWASTDFLSYLLAQRMLCWKAVKLIFCPKLKKQSSLKQESCVKRRIIDPTWKRKSCCSVFIACSQSVLGLNKMSL